MGLLSTNNDTDLSLDNVEPYDPEAFQAVESTYNNVSVPSATTYTAPSTYDPGDTGTVSGQLDGLLADDSSYMENAWESGQRNAASRGLQNSSLSSEASQKAAIDAALPIAQQDATTYATAGLSKQESDQDAALQSQLYGDSANLVNVEGAASSQLSSQEAAQEGNLTEYTAGTTAGLSRQEAEQTGILDSAQAGYASDLSAQQAGETSELSAQEAGQTSELSHQQMKEDQLLADFNAMLASGFSEQEASQALKQSQHEANLSSELSAQDSGEAIREQTFIDAALDTRHAAEMETEEYIAELNVSSEEKQAFGASVTLYGEQMMKAIEDVQSNPDLDGTAKGVLIGQIQDQYMANLDNTNQVYGFEDIEWTIGEEEEEEEDTEETEDTETEDTEDTETEDEDESNSADGGGLT